MINYKEFLAGGRRWEGVFSGRGCFWMWNASSSASLRCEFLCWSKTVTPFQSTLWLAFHACSAIADTLKSAIFTAHPSSCTASSWFLPCRWPGILHMRYSRLHVISPCQCATSTSTSNSTGTHVNSDTTSNDIRMSFCASFCVCMKDTNSDELVT